MNAILTKILQKLTTNENDPTFSNRIKQRKKAHGIFAQATTNESNNSVDFRIYENNKRNGSRPIGTKTKYWIYPLCETYKELQNSRISNNAFNLRFNQQFIELNASNKTQQLQEELKKIASPYDISKDSEYLGLFFDGTGAFCDQSQTNVYTLCKYYEGNKYYYGGIGNSIENTLSTLKAAIATTRIFDFNIERALSDIKEYTTQKKRQPKIQLIGFSRGAAQANELAKRLKNKFEIDLLLMMDPVYSVGLPGQGSKIVHASPLSKKGNYVETNITNNVRKVIVLYAEHEPRTLFPATKFTLDDKEKTTIIAGLSPGNHCDVGGYRERESAIQYVSLYWMLEKALSGHAKAPFFNDSTQITNQLKRITQNPDNLWYWSDIDWFYILSINPLGIFSDGSKNKILNIFDVIRDTILGDQPEKMELDRIFSPHEFGYKFEKVHDWLKEKDALPINYDYVSKPPNNTTDIV